MNVDGLRYDELQLTDPKGVVGLVDLSGRGWIKTNLSVLSTWKKRLLARKEGSTWVK